MYHIDCNWASHEAEMEEGRTAFKILTGKHIRRRSLRRHRRRFEDNIRINLKEICVNMRNRIDSDQG